jgi:hypothetical protein
MRYILIVLLLLKTFICFPQSDTVKADCDEVGTFMLPYFCPSCEIVPDSLPAVLGFRKVTISTTVDSNFSSEFDPAYDHSDSFVYIIKARKASCPVKIDATHYYDKAGFLYKTERALFSLPNNKMCFNKTTYTRDEKGRELIYSSHADTICDGYGESKYDKKGKLVKHIYYSKFFDYTFNDTLQFKYDRRNRLKTKLQKGIFGENEWQKTIYSKDGLLSVTKLYTEGSPKHGSLMDSTFYNNRHLSRPEIGLQVN